MYHVMQYSVYVYIYIYDRKGPAARPPFSEGDGLWG